jgi:hypothetical protein
MTASSWRRLSETDYFLDEPQAEALSPPNGLETLDTQALLSSDEDDEDEALSLPSAGVANVRGETPDLEDEDVAEEVDIGELDWGDADKEVNDFLAEIGEDAVYTTDESDNERFFSPQDLAYSSVTSNVSETRRKRKRKRQDTSHEASDADDSDSETPAPKIRSRLAKRIQTANSRRSQLSKSVTIASSKPSSEAPSPNGSSHVRTPVEGSGGGGSVNGSAVDHDSAEDDADEEDSDLDDWANEFEAELV